jgi:signal transduction histidine kinase
MESLRTFISLNRDIIYFGYGLVFFVLGLSIALQSRNYSRLDLARSLQWLAAFGFTHGLHEWGDLFIPIQTGFLSPETIEFLHILHLLLLAASYTFLFEFGVALLRPLGRARWLNGVSIALASLWVVVAFAYLPMVLGGLMAAHDTANALARYFIGFPGGMLSAYALRQHTMERIVPLEVPHIVKVLRFSGVMLALYAVFGGLIPPPVGFFPGNIINSASFEQALIAPPPVFRSIVGFGLAIAIIRALEIFDVETARLIESMEQGQILAAERDRLARDLHDGAIQKVYTAGLLVESASKIAAADNSILAGRLEKAGSVLNDAIGDLRHNLEELHSKSVQEPFPLALEKLAADPRYRSMVSITLNLDLPAKETLSAVRAEHVLAIVTEALSNIVRHSRAGSVVIAGRSNDDRLELTIQDDGVGLSSDKESEGYGLRNMRDRARLLGGNLQISSQPGKGTLVELNIPWKDER